MPKVKFTDTFLKSVKPAAKLTDYSDIGCKGLHLRVTPAGIKTFQLVYRSKLTGKIGNEKIGRYPEISLAVAHDKVTDAWKLIAQSKPVAFTAVKKNEPTVADRLKQYDEERLSKKRTRRNMMVALTTFITTYRLADLPYSSLTKQQLWEPLKEIEKKTPRHAGNVQTMLSTFLKWGVINDYREANPLAGMPCVGGEAPSRKRVLTEAELRKLWQVLHHPQDYDLLPVYADALLLILTTGCRPGEACGLAQHELFGFGDFGEPYKRGAGPIAELLEERMKMGRAFVLPLNSLALDVLNRRLAKAHGYKVLFPTPSKNYEDKGEQLRVRRLSERCGALCEQLGWTAEGQGPGSYFTPHDLRRTGYDLLCREYKANDVDPLFAHATEVGTQRTYRPEHRWNDFDAKRAISDRLAEMLREIVQPKLTVVADARAA